MEEIINKFLDNTLDKVSEMYGNDEFESCQDAVDALCSAIYNFFEEKRPDLECKIVEYDEEYDDIIEFENNVGQILKGRKLEDFFTTTWNDIHFYVLLLKKGE